MSETKCHNAFSVASYRKEEIRNQLIRDIVGVSITENTGGNPPPPPKKKKKKKMGWVNF